ncbi:hypothetical protein D9757_004077 [Collybiopsis confluens]|uniref:Transmembrane protein n=1 Tax=Collybiopsis confluens TaxID=2823264 RepID=A0A8H5MCM6_9AGAR|nr:hypothetical protein D9757_004077 [Collybiopsis confluens]
MLEWTSQAEVSLDSNIFVKLIHSVTGLYLWEVFLAIDFDWDVISRKKPFRWPLIFYFANRYLLLFALVGVLISFDATTKLDCQALYIFVQLCGNSSVGLASINLSLRTLAIYNDSGPLAIILTLVILGHWSLILQAPILLEVNWDDQSGQCQIISTNNLILAATFIYSMVFDLFVFLLTAYKLFFRHNQVSVTGSNRLGRMLFYDGLIYFFIAFLSNLLATVFMLLNLNFIMTVIFNIPAAIASTIVACRVVRRLRNFGDAEPETEIDNDPMQFRQASGMSSTSMSWPARNEFRSGRSGVHVQIEVSTNFDSEQRTQSSSSDHNMRSEQVENMSVDDAESKTRSL